MQTTTPCRSLAELQNFMDRARPSLEVDELAIHLEECEPCSRTMDRLLEQDSYQNTLRSQDTSVDLVGDKTVTQLIEKFRGQVMSIPLQKAAEDKAHDSVSLELQQTAPGVEDSRQIPTAGSEDCPQTLTASPQESFPFLEPARSAHELGWLGDYRVLSVLGKGGMGVVFKAEDGKLKRTVALKVMLPSIAASEASSGRFLREAQALAAVVHDHIVRVYQVGEIRKVLFIAMEFLHGELLEKTLERGESIAMTEAIRIGREIAEGLQLAHTNGLIHRDIKPGNIWLEKREQVSRHTSSRPRVKILDFGLARAENDSAHLTREGLIIGTPAFMSPEQASGRTVDARSDLFSLGVLLYRMTTGKLPFRGGDTISTLMAVSTQDPPVPSRVNCDIPQPLSELIMKLLAKNPNLRFRSAQDLVEALEQLELDVTQALPAFELPAPKEPSIRARKTPPPSFLGAKTWVTLLFVGLLTVAGLIYVKTNKGTFKIETADNVKVVVEQNGEEVQIVDTTNGNEVKLQAGEYQLKLKDANDSVLSQDTLHLKRGGVVVVTVTKVTKQEVLVEKSKPVLEGVDADWRRSVASLAPEQQVEAVLARLKELNPKFDGKAQKQAIDPEKKQVVELRLFSDHLTDISPLRALAELKILSLNGNSSQQHLPSEERTSGGIEDLSPLKGLPLRYLSISGNQVHDLSFVAGMPLSFFNCSVTKVTDLTPLERVETLTTLQCYHTRVADLKPVRNLRELSSLDCTATLVTDIAPLENLRLTSLTLNKTKISDLKPLHRMTSLDTLGIQSTPVADLAPLRELKKLTTLYCASTQVTDLEPLADLPKLSSLICNGNKIKDLSPLKKCEKLASIVCDFDSQRDGPVLRSMQQLQQIRGMSVGEFWARNP